jgi:hypothetical protein
MHVRFAPKATIGDQTARRRFVPIVLQNNFEHVGAKY